MKRNIIADLDGTIALDDHRRELITKEGCEAYFQECHMDVPNWPVIKVLRSMYLTGYNIHIITGRSETTRVATKAWLVKHGVEYSSLSMLKQHHYLPDAKDFNYGLPSAEVKFSMAMKLGLTPDNTLFVVEDRDDITQFWRVQGFDCWQVRHEGVLY